MLRVLVICVVLTTAICGMDALYISWYPDYSEARTAIARKPYFPYYKTYTYKPSVRKVPQIPYYNQGSIMIEDNEICSKFHCDKKPCCSGECISAFGTQMCVILSNRYGYGKR